MLEYATGFRALDRWLNRRLAPNTNLRVVVLYFYKGGMIGDDAVNNELEEFNDMITGVHQDPAIRMLAVPVREMKAVEFIFGVRSYPTALVLRADLSEAANVQLRSVMNENPDLLQPDVPDVNGFFARLQAEITNVVNQGIVHEHRPPPEFRARLTLVINVREDLEYEFE